MTHKFSLAIEKTLSHEGGYVNDPNDPGGETNWGIAKKFYPDVDIKNLTREGDIEIYHKDFWIPLHCEDLPENIALEIFDTAVNTSQRRAAKILQGSLILLGNQVTLDGVIGSQTVTAVSVYPHQDALLKCMNGFQFMVYVLGAASEDEVIQMIRSRKGHVQRYLRGWLARVEF